MIRYKHLATLIGSLSMSSVKPVAVATLDTGAFVAPAGFLPTGRSGGSVELALFRRGLRTAVLLGVGRAVKGCAFGFAFAVARVVRVVVGTLLVVVFVRVEARAVGAFALLAIWVAFSRVVGRGRGVSC